MILFKVTRQKQTRCVATGDQGRQLDEERSTPPKAQKQVGNGINKMAKQNGKGYILAKLLASVY